MKRLLIIAMSCVALISCSNGEKPKEAITTEKGVVQVLYFHGPQRCATCIAVEEQTRKELEADFKNEMENGKITMSSIDFLSDSGEALAEKYEISFSSLILDKDGKVIDLTDMAFTYAKTQPEVFKKQLKQEIVKLLQ